MGGREGGGLTIILVFQSQRETLNALMLNRSDKTGENAKLKNFCFGAFRAAATRLSLMARTSAFETRSKALAPDFSQLLQCLFLEFLQKCACLGSRHVKKKKDSCVTAFLRNPPGHSTQVVRHPHFPRILFTADSY